VANKVLFDDTNKQEQVIPLPGAPVWPAPIGEDGSG